jgi:hypothetical protein
MRYAALRSAFVAAVAIICAAAGDVLLEYAGDAGWLGALRDTDQRGVAPALGIAGAIVALLIVGFARTSPAAAEALFARLRSPHVRTADLGMIVLASSVVTIVIELYETGSGGASPFAGNSLVTTHLPALLTACAIVAPLARIALMRCVRLAARSVALAAAAVVSFLERAQAGNHATPPRFRSTRPMRGLRRPYRSGTIRAFRAPPSSRRLIVA